MIPAIVLAVSFAAFSLAGLGVPYFADWQHALRAAFGVMFLLTASAHWGKRRPDLIRMVPAVFGNAGMWVTLTGIAEILIAAALQVPRAALPVGILAEAMLICIFPANVKAAREKLTIGGRPVPPLDARIAIQAVFVAALAAGVWPR
ncbi:MAG: DoxX family protein [Terracidiphilus sp.]